MPCIGFNNHEKIKLGSRVRFNLDDEWLRLTTLVAKNGFIRLNLFFISLVGHVTVG